MKVGCSRNCGYNAKLSVTVLSAELSFDKLATL